MTLKWTRTPPTEAGWYWMRQRGYTGGGVVYVDFQTTSGPRYYPTMAALAAYPGLPVVDIEWAGPIPSPEEAS